jgi:3-hydroxyacyl-CoA dehydrogenase / enoyl-CoA hydratase / 3-hydroxybutyryl-CoA epimerase
MSKHTRLEVNEGIATLCLDQADSKVNVLGPELFGELQTAVSKLENDSSCTGLLITSAKSGQFIAGADISTIKGVRSIEAGRTISREAQILFDRLERLKFPTVVAINGNCLGGGLELALATGYRLASDDRYTIGLPEVQLGVIPGAGGTQRLPKLIGLKAALDLILAGKRIKPSAALKQGVVDEVVPASLLESRALAALKELIAKKGRACERVAKRERSVSTKLLENLAARSFLPTAVRRELLKKTKGQYPAPLKALEAVLASQGKNREEGYQLEAELFGECSAGSVSRSLIHLYEITTANRSASDQLAAQHPWKTTPIGVLGAGLMGSGISTVLANLGFQVRVRDPREQGLAGCLAYADKVNAKDEKRRRIRKFDRQQRLSRISPSLDYSGFDHCSFVIEAVFEDVDLKRQMVKEVAEHSGPQTIFASNTSSIPIHQIAEASEHPDRVIGMHFFSPVEKMQLVEVVVTPQTSPEVLSATVGLAKKMNTHVIVVGDGPGFFTTRVLAAYLAQAIALYMEGAHADQIDEAMTSLGFPVGPMVLMDEVGLDVAQKVIKVMANALPERFSVPERWQDMMREGKRGKKDGRGFYKYDAKTKEPDFELYDIATKGINARIISPIEIQDRCLYAFLAECTRTLEEGILRSEADGDLASVFGLGFPPFLGGPFHFMSEIGQNEVARKLASLESRYGPLFSIPDSLLSGSTR